jgi:hypothetical protein
MDRKYDQLWNGLLDVMGNSITLVTTCNEDCKLLADYLNNNGYEVEFGIDRLGKWDHYDRTMDNEAFIIISEKTYLALLLKYS